MRPVDKFGHPIYPKTFRVLQQYGQLLTQKGYRESYKSPNLFVKQQPQMVFFADMRGTEGMPIWDDPSPLFYSQSEIPEDWRHNRRLKAEVLELWQAGIPVRFSFEGTPFRGSTGISEPDRIIDVDDGFCHHCGKDMQQDGAYCSPECEKASTLSYCDHCQVCGRPVSNWLGTKYEEVAREQQHHVSYKPQEVVRVCPSCHAKIHRSTQYPELKPSQKRLAGNKRFKRVRCWRCDGQTRLPVDDPAENGLCQKCRKSIRKRRSKLGYWKALFDPKPGTRQFLTILKDKQQRKKLESEF